MSYDLTYDLATDRLKIWAGRLPQSDFERIRPHGFKRAPQQGYWFATWTPAREDLLLQHFGAEIDDEISDPTQIAQDKADRYRQYSDNAADRSQAAYERSTQITKHIPVGQPILVGHHSERRHRADLRRSDNAMRKSVAEGKKSDYWEQRAAVVRGNAQRKETPGAIVRKIDTLEAEHRRLEREQFQAVELGNQSIEAHYQRWIDHIDKRLTYERQRYAEAGTIAYSQATIQKGDYVKYCGSWFVVKRVNKKSVTVDNWMGIDGWTYLAAYDKITGHRPKADE